MSETADGAGHSPDGDGSPTTGSASAFDARAIARRGGIATGVALAGNALVIVLATTAFGVPGSFEPLKPAPTLLTTIIATAGATGVYAALDRVTSVATHAFNVVAAIVLGLSFLLVFGFAIYLPAANATSLSFVALTHTVPATACVGLLPEY